LVPVVQQKGNQLMPGTHEYLERLNQLIKTFLSILEILRIETYFKQLIIGKI
jgi:hypothetical protein